MRRPRRARRSKRYVSGATLYVQPPNRPGRDVFTFDRLACEAWNKLMLGFQGPAQPSPALSNAVNVGFGYLEVKCLGCNTHQTIALDIVRRPKSTPIHELERYMRCKDCSRAVQAQPSDSAAAVEDFCRRSCINMVAARARLRWTVFDHRHPRSDPAPISNDEQVRRQSAADDRRVSRLSCAPWYTTSVTNAK